MGKERVQKRNFSLAITLVLVAAMFSFYLSPSTTGQHYVYSENTLDGSPNLYQDTSQNVQVVVPCSHSWSCNPPCGEGEYCSGVREGQCSCYPQKGYERVRQLMGDCGVLVGDVCTDEDLCKQTHGEGAFCEPYPGTFPDPWSGKESCGCYTYVVEKVV